MAIITIRDIRKLSPEAQTKRLASTRKELQEKYSQLSAGGSIDNPSRIKELRRTIARFITVINEKRE